MRPVLDWCRFELIRLANSAWRNEPVRVCNAAHVLWLSVALSLTAAEVGDGAYRTQIQKWREGYEADLRKDNGWLTLAGLYWVREGDNRFGSGPGNDIVLSRGSAPDVAGTFVFHGRQTRLMLNNGVSAQVNGVPVRNGIELRPDSAGKPDRITLGRLSMIVIERGNRYAIRLWDNAGKTRSEFAGVRWFPVNEAYRVTAQFTSYPQPRMIPILNILGDTEPTPSPGYATFELAGKQCHLEPLAEGDRLFFIFKDLTSGKQTYPAGRFLYANLPKDGKVALDFNEAINPPCAFTDFATCPLPPKQNYLPVAVPAGELNHKHASGSH
jgi:uncharacterized protein